MENNVVVKKMESKDTRWIMFFRKHPLLKQMYRCRALYMMIIPAIITVFIFH